MFSKRTPNIDEVRIKLLKHIREEKEKINQSAFNDKDGKLPLTVNLIILTPKDLVPTARQIINTETVNLILDSVEERKKLLGQEALATIPIEDVDFYLQVLLFTLESFVSLSARDKEIIRTSISTNGSVIHQTRAVQFTNSKLLAKAEEEFQRALNFDRLYPMGGNIVCTLSNLGQATWNQGRVKEARKFFEEALELFTKLPLNAPAYKPAKQSADYIERNRHIIFAKT